MNLKGSGGIFMDNMDDMFNDSKLEKALKKAKRKSSIKIILISMLVAVFVVITGITANNKITNKMAFKKSNEINNLVELSIPNGYVSRMFLNIGFLGGDGTYRISKRIGNKSVILEDNGVIFGKISRDVFTIYANGFKSSGKWPDQYWEYGYRKMIFFHPDIQYKEYRNDWELFDKLPDDKIIEIGVSLDKPYRPLEVFHMLPKVDEAWYWVDAFKEDELSEYKKMVKDSDPSVCFIREGEIVTVKENYHSYDFKYNYKELMDNMKGSGIKRYEDIYNMLKSKNYEDPGDVPVLGFIVQGTKEQLKVLKDNPHIKAISVGVFTDKY